MSEPDAEKYLYATDGLDADRTVRRRFGKMLDQLACALAERRGSYKGQHVLVEDIDFVNAGEILLNGAPNPFE